MTKWIAAAVVLAASAAAFAEPLTVYTNGSTLKIVGAGNQTVLEIGPLVWGPKWAWTGVQGNFQAVGDGASVDAQGQLGGTNAPFILQIKATPAGKRQLNVDYQFSVKSNTDLTLAVVSVTAGGALHGKGRATVTDDRGSREVDLPLGRGSLSEGLKSLAMRDGDGNTYTLSMAKPVPATQDNAARLVLAADHLDVGDVRTVSFTIDLPQDTAMYLTPGSLPQVKGADEWFEWKGTGHSAKPSVIDASSLLDAPAGRYGRVTRRDDQLIYHGKPMKFWGLNVCFGNTAPHRNVADQRVDLYARYGINTVRLHKFADGSGWSGILSKDSYTEYDPQGLERMDYFVAKLKEKGIYVTLSANFGRARIFPGDKQRVPYANEFGNGDRKGVIDPGGGAMFLSTELQDIQIDQIVNLLKHRNPHTGKTYAEDPAVLCVELVNEDSILFYSTLKAMNQSATLKQRAGRAFADWLKKKYRTKETLLAAWGPSMLNNFTAEKGTGESWEQGVIYPIGSPWFYDPENLATTQAARKARLLDTMQFLYEMQNAFYDRFVAALRKAGYTGEVLASNWQAGRAYSHFLNLHSDSRIGLIDRHNYFGGNGSMLANPGSGMLSAGMQQVDDRPFMLSEWIHVYPNEFGAEGPALIGAYGMGLNGWDVSYMFQNGDSGTFSGQLKDKWDVTTPQVLGVFPAVARQVLRGDVAESDLVFHRNVHVPSLAKGELGFDDRVTQQYDVKEFGSDAVPASTLAIGRSVVDFTPNPQPTQPVDLTKSIVDGVVRSATGELAWTAGNNPRSGYFTINSPRTQALVGFAEGKTADLRDVTLTSGSKFAAIYVTALGDKPIAADDHLLITTIARARNTGMKVVGGDIVQAGRAPLVMEPVRVELALKRRGTPIVYVLDHDGVRTGQTIEPVDGKFTLDGAQTHAVYYEVTFALP